MFVDSFSASCSVEIFGPGEELLQRGSMSDDLYLLVDGTIKFTSSSAITSDTYDKNGNSVAGGSMTDSAFGAPVQWSEMSGGDFINDIGFFTESPNTHTVRTVTVCKTLTMPKAVYKMISEDHPGSVSIIVQNLLVKAKKQVEVFEGSSPNNSPQRLELMRAV
jgi:CRP-like cAMP-binding protein